MLRHCHNLSLICQLTSEDIKQHYLPTGSVPFPPVSLQRQVVCLLLRPVFMCSSQGRAYTVSWLVQNKKLCYSNLRLVTLHPCFQPASLTPHPAPLHQELGEEGDYLTLHCHHQNDSCILMGSDGSRFNVSLIVWTKSQDSVRRPQLLNKRGEPKRNRTEVLLLTSLTPYR